MAELIDTPCPSLYTRVLVTLQLSLLMNFSIAICPTRHGKEAITEQKRLLRFALLMSYNPLALRIVKTLQREREPFTAPTMLIRNVSRRGDSERKLQRTLRKLEKAGIVIRFTKQEDLDGIFLIGGDRSFYRLTEPYNTMELPA